MSKSKGNTVEPWAVLDAHGADAFRWYFFTSKQPWDGYRFSEEAIGEGVRLFLKQLWSTYFFYGLYANANADALADGGDFFGGGRRRAPMIWTCGRCRAPPRMAELVGERLEAYDATTAGRAIAELVDELSNWYVRRSRRRFWDGDPAAFTTLRTCLLIVSKLLAPFCPSSRMRSTTTSMERWRAFTCATSPRPLTCRRATADWRRRWRSRARPCAWVWARGDRRRSRCASPWPRPWWWRRAASARRSSASRTSCARSSTCAACASWPEPRSWASTR